MAGLKCSDCNYCWNIEAQGNMSDRHYSQWRILAMDSFDDIVNNPETDAPSLLCGG